MSTHRHTGDGMNDMAKHCIKAPPAFIADCLDCECDVGEYANGHLTATDEQLAELRSRAKHYAYGGTDGAPLWMVPAARALLRAIEQVAA